MPVLWVECIAPRSLGKHAYHKVLVSITGAQDRLRLGPAKRREGHIVVARRQVGSIMIGLGVYFKSEIKHRMPHGCRPVVPSSAVDMGSTGSRKMRRWRPSRAW